MASALLTAALVALAAVLAVLYGQPLLALFASSMDSSAPQNRTVVVVGGGLAGMSAALEAAMAGASVVLIDKEKAIGGNSAKASSGINGAATPAQSAKQITDSVETLKADTIKSGGGFSDPSLVDVLVQSSRDAIAFLASFGVNLEEVTICGGHTVPRTHRSKAPAKGNIGWHITSTLKQKIEAMPQIQVRPNARLESLVVTDGRVRGVKYVNTTSNDVITLLADAVVLTTGGFAADKSGLLAQHSPATASLPTTNGPFATGDGVKIASRDADAALLLMDKVQVHPTGLLDPKSPAAGTVILGAEALRGSGGILVDKDGARFVSELGYRSVVTDAILHNGFPFAGNGPTVAYLLLNDEAVNLFQASAFGFYVSKGLATKFNSAAELVAQKNLHKLFDTLKEYNEAKAAGKDRFGKVTFPVAFDPEKPIYAMYVTPAIHYTMGGVRINTNTQVLNAKGDVIPGLYAAGEVTGGVHGENRLAGNSLLECVVYGRRAGKAASGASL